VVWSVSQLLYLLQPAGHFKFLLHYFFVGLGLISQRVVNKNYVLGQKQAAYVGEPLVKVRDYSVDRIKLNRMRASDDFQISGGPVTILGQKGREYQVRGLTTIGGTSYTVVNVPGGTRGQIRKADI
jgi:hypothetical protein